MMVNYSSQAELSVRGVFEGLPKESPDFLLSGSLIHQTRVHVGYSAFAVNQRREGHPVESVLLAQSLVANHDRVGSPFSL